jgi:ABC-type sugar transport system ATPase subunit
MRWAKVQENILKLEKINKTFKKVYTLKNVNFSLNVLLLSDVYTLNLM